MSMKHVHHAPAFSGALSGAIAKTANTVTGVAAVTVLNNPHDSQFKAGAVVGQYGTLTIDALGNWSYALDKANAAVVALAGGASLTDTILTPTIYNFRDTTGVNIVITING